MAARIGSPLDPAVELDDTQGHRLAGDEARLGNDTVRAYRIPADGDYVSEINPTAEALVEKVLPLLRKKPAAKSSAA